MRGNDRLFVGIRHPLFGFLKSVYEEGKEGRRVDEWLPIPPHLAEGLSGDVKFDDTATAPGAVYKSHFNCDGYLDVQVGEGAGRVVHGSLQVNNCLLVGYRDPVFPADFVFPATRLAGATAPERTLRPEDWNPRRNGPYRPNTGFTRDRPQAQLADAGHRMVKHEVGNQHRVKG